MKQQFSFIQKFTSLLMILAMFSPLLAAGRDNGKSGSSKPLTENQKIIHVLNRLGFGGAGGRCRKS